MKRTWLLRILRGTAAAFLVGAVVGGLEVGIVLRASVTEMVHALGRLHLWAVNAGLVGALAGAVGLALSAALGAVAGQDPDTRSLALATDRDPRYPWLPWVLGGALAASLGIVFLPASFRLPPERSAASVMLLALAGIAGAVFAIGLRFFLRRVDRTGKGGAVALLGLPTLLIVSMSFAVGASMAGGDGKASRAREGLPNLLLISVDGLRADHAGPGARVRTGSLNWMAREGVRFLQATTPSTSESPPLGALLTGYHPLSSRFAADGGRLPERVPGLGKPLKTLAEVFAEEGFRTGAFVSSVGLDGRATGLSRGFEVYDDGIGFVPPGAGRLAVPTVLRWLTTSSATPPPPEELLRPAAATLVRFERWLAWHYRENFFAWVHLSDPRMPNLLADGQDDALLDPIPGEAGRAYGARVAQLDEVLGELFKALESDGLFERTVVAVVGTRGYLPGGGRPTVGEAWSQVPVFVVGPGIEGGVALPHQVRLEDLAPTLLSAAGLRRPRMGQGVSLVSTMAGEGALQRLEALIVGPPRPQDGKAEVALRAGDWKFTRDPRNTDALYDLGRDPQELHDVKEANAERAAATARSLDEVLGGHVPVLDTPVTDPGRRAELRGLNAAR
jgi:arylsulfatase A-like enzyme